MEKPTHDYLHVTRINGDWNVVAYYTDDQGATWRSEVLGSRCISRAQAESKARFVANIGTMVVIDGEDA